MNDLVRDAIDAEDAAYLALDDLAAQLIEATRAIAHHGGDDPYDGVLEALQRRVRAAVGSTDTDPLAPALQPCVYMALDELGVAIYVGSTTRIASRLSQHKSKAGWWGEHARIVIQWQPDEETARRAEIDLIKEARPRFNVQHNR